MPGGDHQGGSELVTCQSKNPQFWVLARTLLPYNFRQTQLSGALVSKGREKRAGAPTSGTAEVLSLFILLKTATGRLCTTSS